MKALVGRRRELDLLRGLLRQVRDGGHAAACISGDPGIGKTRLLRALEDDARAAGWPSTASCRGG